MKKLLLSMGVISLLSSSIYGSCTAASCKDKITKIYTTYSGLVYIGTAGNEKALDCAGGAGNGGVSGVYLSLDMNQKGANAIYSLLLTAKSLNKTIELRVIPGSSRCSIAYATMN